jgi:hypothetical protein
VLGARTLSTSGRQLFLIDNFRNTEKPLLAVLADPGSIFIHALTQFQSRSLYTNIVNDRTAVHYTTGISKHDPYVDLSKVELHYIEGYEPVILDPKRPYHLIAQDALPPFSQRLRTQSQTYLRRAPIILALMVLLPLATVAFLINSGVQTFRSRRRIQLHESDHETKSIRMYRLMRDVRVGLEDAFENVNAAQQPEYLPESSEGIAKANVERLDLPCNSFASSSDALPSEKSGSGDPLLSASLSDLPALALTSQQFAMIKALDEVGFQKYPVHIHKSSHSHAAIIVRMPRAAFEEGKLVVKHWVEHFRI